MYLGIFIAGDIDFTVISVTFLKESAKNYIFRLRLLQIAKFSFVKTNKYLKCDQD